MKNDLAFPSTTQAQLGDPIDLDAARRQLKNYVEMANVSGAIAGLSGIGFVAGILYSAPTILVAAGVVVFIVAGVIKNSLSSKANELTKLMKWEASIQTAQNTQALMEENRALRAKLINGQNYR